MLVKRFLLSAVVVAFFSLFFLVKNPVYAATITVDTTIDEAATTDGNCTLREAITAANTDLAVDNCTAGSGTDTINIPATPITPITLVSALPSITTNMTISGAGMTTTTIDANGSTGGRGFINSGSSVVWTVQNMTIQNGNILGNGGAINNSATLTLTNAKLINNTAVGFGGGLYTNKLTTATNVTISGNTGGSGGGGIYNTGSGTPVASLVLSKATISGNNADYGGGIYDDNGMTLTNVTITGNTANTQRGGGVYDASYQAGNAWLNVTIANNTATLGLGGGNYFSGSVITFKNVLISGNSPTNCAGSFNSSSSLGNNMSSDNTCATKFNQTGDQNNVSTSSIALGSLQDNGGSIYTMALGSSSVAIDAGTNTGAPATDAIGTSRPQDGDNNGVATTDIGAYEYVYVAPSPTATPVPSSGGSTSSPLAPLSTNTTDTPVCGDAKPQDVPEVFQINTTSKSATIYFTPVQNSTSYYYVSYGYTPGDQRFGVQFDGSHEGVQHYTINALSPNTTYYFQIRAGNGCMPGDFSNNLKAKTSRTLVQKLIFYLHGGK